MLEIVRKWLRITTTDFDSELELLITAASLDLGLAGVENLDTTDPLIVTAICTYCKMNFGQPDEYDRLKRSYDEQKAQLGMASNYTDYSMLED